MNFVYGGLDPSSRRAEEHAVSYYAEIRGRRTDCDTIAKNTQFSYEQIVLIKMYIFFATHDLDYGHERFEPDFAMAESWRRLSSKDPKHIQSHDIVLLQHELCEISYILQGIVKIMHMIWQIRSIIIQRLQMNFMQGRGIFGVKCGCDIC